MGRTREEVIETLNVALLAAGESMRSASLKLGLNHSYLAQFMKKEDYSPEVLPEEVRIALANLLGLDQKTLRIDLRDVSSINHTVGSKPYPEKVVRQSTDRRSTEMRVDYLIEELGRIKERLERLERQATEPQGMKGKTIPRP